jgi:hypothetical protein
MMRTTLSPLEVAVLECCPSGWPRPLEHVLHELSPQFDGSEVVRCAVQLRERRYLEEATSGRVAYERTELGSARLRQQRHREREGTVA